MVIDLLDLEVAVNGDAHRRRGNIVDVVQGEHDVVGGEGFAVVPFDAGLELPGDRFAVGGEAAVLDRRDFGRKDRVEIAVHVPARQRLIEQARAVLILGAGGKMRVEQGRRLPPQ